MTSCFHLGRPATRTGRTSVGGFADRKEGLLEIVGVAWKQNVTGMLASLLTMRAFNFIGTTSEIYTSCRVGKWSVLEIK